MAMRGNRLGKGIAMVLVAAVGALSAGCFGKFQLTRKLYDINQSIDEKYVRSAATWIFVIPYAVTGLLDFVVFNVIEFWTGENPVAEAKVTKVYAQGNGRTVLSLSRDGSATVAVIERYEGEEPVSTLRVRDDGAGKVTAVETAAGKKVREVVAVATSDGSVDVTVATAAGVGTERYPAASVRAQDTRVARIASEVARASRGAAGTIPLAAAARVPAYGG
jgi:3D (Asp-Asp-Asp) domain-containing protein